MCALVSEIYLPFRLLIDMVLRVWGPHDNPNKYAMHATVLEPAHLQLTVAFRLVWLDILWWYSFEYSLGFKLS